MNRNFIVLFLVLVAFTASAQYSIDWSKISGGGGASSGGNFSVSGTIGQADAANTLTGGNFSLTGGFWALYAVLTPGSPPLMIYAVGPNSAVVAWPTSSSSGFLLQENNNLASTNWINSTNAISTINGTNQMTVSPLPGNKFYRLFHP